MRHVGYVVVKRQSLNYLLPNEKYSHQKKRQRNFAILKAGEGRQQHKSKYYAAGSAQGCGGKENVVDQSGDQGCNDDHLDQGGGTVFSSDFVDGGVELGEFFATAGVKQVVLVVGVVGDVAGGDTQ